MKMLRLAISLFLFALCSFTSSSSARSFITTKPRPIDSFLPKSKLEVIVKQFRFIVRFWSRNYWNFFYYFRMRVCVLTRWSLRQAVPRCLTPEIRSVFRLVTCTATRWVFFLKNHFWFLDLQTIHIIGLL